MAATISTWVMASNGNNVHPFFQKPTHAALTETTHTTASCAKESPNISTLEDGEPPPQKPTEAQSGVVSNPDTDPEQTGSNIAKAARKTRTSPRSKPQATIDDFAISLAREDPSEHRAKRQRTDSPAPDHGNAWLTRMTDAPSKPQEHDTSDPAATISSLPQVQAHASHDNVSPQHATGKLVSGLAFGKELVLNGRGGFGTPPKPESKRGKRAKGDVVNNTPPKRGRPKKSLIVAMKYKSATSEGDSIGKRISDILAGAWEYRPATPEKAAAVTPTVKAAINPSKPVHSFFSSKPNIKEDDLRKAKTAETVTQVPSTLRFGTTPRKSRPVQIVDDLKESSFEHDRRIRHIRQARSGGMVEAPWPGPGWSRIEPTGEAALDQRNTSDRTPIFHPRRRKDKPIQVRSEESIVARMQTAHFPRPAPLVAVRDLPRRSVETGASILGKIGHMLSKKFASHAAITTLTQNMPSAMSSFDHGTGDVQCWSDKYAPRTASQILHTGKEPTILRDWLQGLTINSVERASTQNETRRKPQTKPPKRRGRRKADEMDDFLVDSDEDMEDELHVLSDDDDLLDTAQRTIVRNGGVSTDSSRASQRLSNAVLLSGPYGCGKSAAAYAVARELGFDVFEINPGSRRSGKDIIDKVGDMALNHQVRRDVSAAVTGQDPAPTNSDEELREPSPPPDMRKQKSLNSFFTATASKPKPKAKPKDIIPQTERVKQFRPVQGAFALIKEATKQKQSLILFEEVDILFDDDKLFWESLLDLAVQSKRPIIMTCNDESLVPLNALSLHGILRFRRPPVDLAVDYLLVVAATEGHILRRDIVEGIYKDKSGDLRASIAQLNFLCQMGIGDEKGGLGWFLPRWPPGTDVDASGAKLRVVSTDTCTEVMGSFSPASNHDSEPRVEELAERNIDIAELALAAQKSWFLQNASLSDTSSGLRQHSRNLDLLSSVDIYAPAQSGSASALHDRLDATQPPMADKTKHSFITGYGLVQADFDRDERQTASSMALAAHLSMIDEFREPAIPVSGYNYAALLKSQEKDHNVLNRQHLRRVDFSAAFDSISSCEASTDGLTASCFDGTFKIVTEDLAPYVRSIVSYDVALEQRRSRLDALLGGRSNKRQRTTRAARSAFEGGQRATTRKERWFPKHLDHDMVMKTGGPSWPQPSVQSLNVEEQDMETSSRASTDPFPASQ